MKNKADISNLLKTALGRLKKDNPQVSLRAIAKRMELSPSYLSKLIRGEKPIPLHLVSILKGGLHLDIIETESLQRLILEMMEQNKVTTTTGIKSIYDKPIKLDSYKSLSKRDFLLLEKWYYIPLLNLTTLKTFKNDAEWISQRLKIPKRDVEYAIKHLIRSGYLYEKSGSLVVDTKRARFPTDKSHESIRRYHQAMMKMATLELDTKTDLNAFDCRLINGVSFAGDSRKIAQAKTILNRAIYEVAELMSEDNPDHVFQINLQFFKVTT